MILAVDTATEFAGLALANADAIWAEDIWHAARNHTVELMPRLDRMLKEVGLSMVQLSGISVAIGPGSYTGVRVAVAIAKGLALPHQLPLIGIPTLDITAYPHQDQPYPVIAVAQAGRKRILAARYQSVDGIWTQTHSPELTTMTELAPKITEPVLVTGEINESDAAYLQTQSAMQVKIAPPFARVRRPGVLAELGARQLAVIAPHELLPLEPVYLKEP